MGPVDEGPEVGLEDAGILAGGLLHGPIEGIEDLEKAGRLRGDTAGHEGIELFPGIFSKPGAIRSVVSLEEFQESDGLTQVEFRLPDREHCGHLLLGGKGGDSLGHGDGEEGIGKERGDLGRKPLQDGETLRHPGLLLLQATGDGMDGEAFPAVEIVEEIEFLPKRGAPGRIIEPVAVELGLGAGPGLLDDPRLLCSLGLQGEEPLEAVDEEELAAVFDDHEGMIAVDVGGDRLGQEEFGGDVSKGDFTDAHSRPPGIAFPGGRERTWKVG